MFQKFINWLKTLPWINDTFLFLIILGLSIVSYFILKDIVFRILRRVAKKTATQIDDILFSKMFLRRAALLAPLLLLYQYSYLVESIKTDLTKIIEILIVLVVFLSIGAILTSFIQIYEKIEKLKERPIKGYIQVVKIIHYSFMMILLIGIIFGQSVWSILTGLGAFTAILILIFRDTILNFMASMQISSYDLVRVGDWIEVPKFGADGDVIDISLMIVKIQNADKTITMIPTYKLIEESFKNWRGMQNAGVRRIKRAVFIDQSSIKFCDDEMLVRFEKIPLISDFVKSKRIPYKNGKNELTNIGVFRQYLKEFLRQRADISKDAVFQVRQLPSTVDGLPIEIYAYLIKTNFIEYEDAQAEMFDHIIAIVSMFDLSLFQKPSGKDFGNFLRK